MTKESQARDLLARVARDHRPAALASSLSAEDMVLADLIGRERVPVEIFVLDTGRLHGDTLDLIGRIERRYGIAVRIYHPQPRVVSEYVVRFGRDAFYESAELRSSAVASARSSRSSARWPASRPGSPACGAISLFFVLKFH